MGPLLTSRVWVSGLVALFAGSCASKWPTPAELHSDEARADATAQAKAVLVDQGADLGDREQAAHLLGRLGDPCLGCAALFAWVIGNPHEPEVLRAHAAWSLGRLEEADAVEELVNLPRDVRGETVSAYLLDALWGKQDRIFADAELKADLAESLNVFAARRKAALPRSALALQRRVATLPVSVRVLDRSIGAWLERADVLHEASLRTAALTVIERLDDAREARLRRPDEAWVEVREAVSLLQRAARVGPASLTKSIWVALGTRSVEPLIARAVAEAFYGAEFPVPGRPTHSPRPGERFVGAWLAERILLSRPSVRASLGEDILQWESSPEVFWLLSRLAAQREVDLVRELVP